MKNLCQMGVQNEVDGCPEWGTATDRTDRGEIQNTHMAYKSYRPHEKIIQDGCPK